MLLACDNNITIISAFVCVHQEMVVASDILNKQNLIPVMMLFLGEIVLNCCTFFYIPCKYLCRILLSEIIITVFMLCFKGKNVKLSPFFNDSSSQDIDNLSAKSL